MKTRRCRLFHRWTDVGMYGFSPLRRCTKCGWWEQFTGYSCVLHPPKAFEAIR